MSKVRTHRMAAQCLSGDSSFAEIGAEVVSGGQAQKKGIGRPVNLEPPVSLCNPNLAATAVPGNGASPKQASAVPAIRICLEAGRMLPKKSAD